MNEWSAHPEVCIPVEWLSTGDPRCPYFEVIEGVNWEVWIMSSGEHETVVYTLKIKGIEILDFDDWPPYWDRPASE